MSRMCRCDLCHAIFPEGRITYRTVSAGRLTGPWGDAERAESNEVCPECHAEECIERGIDPGDYIEAESFESVHNQEPVL